MPAILWSAPTRKVLESELDDLLAVFTKAKLIDNLVDFTQLRSDDRSALQAVLKHATEDSTNLKDFILERAKNPSQTLQMILTNRTLEDLDKIIKEDLTINLINAYQKNQCSINDLGTILLHYISLNKIKQIQKTNSLLKYSLTYSRSTD